MSASVLCGSRPSWVASRSVLIALQPVSEVASGAWMGPDPTVAENVPSPLSKTWVVGVHRSYRGTGSVPSTRARGAWLIGEATATTEYQSNRQHRCDRTAHDGPLPSRLGSDHRSNHGASGHARVWPTVDRGLGGRNVRWSLRMGDVRPDFCGQRLDSGAYAS